MSEAEKCPAPRFDLDGYLAARRAMVDAALDKTLPKPDAPPPLLHQAIRYCVLSDGKRLRPILCLAACEIAGGDLELAMPAAMAIELLHTYTLVHDDLPAMDNDELRRGRPTCHVAFGEATAILTGDALQAMAFEFISRPAPNRSPTAQVNMINSLAIAAGSGGIIRGQIDDIAAQNRNLSPAELDSIHLNKTALLFNTSLQLGALAAGADPATTRALCNYGTALGMAFQITDDLLDRDAPLKNLRGEPNCIAVYGEQTSRQMAESYTRNAKASLASLPDKPIAPLDALADFVLSRTH